ncbi:MAG: hypothetical protein JO023_05610 [Chloroflexi bacterium]|nr:hypothetical protein [Chloroflexota bacterium]
MGADLRPASRRRRGLALPIVLITFGCVLLLMNLLPPQARTAALLLGLGVGFLLARLLSGAYGLAVPAGVLLGLGAFSGVEALRPIESRGGVFFLCLGLGFASIYVIGARPHALWPLLPAALLIVVALLFFGLSVAAALAPWAWLVNIWPLLLVVLGLWLMLRDRLPMSAQRPLAALAVLVLVGYALLVAAALVDASASQAFPLR